MIELRLNIDENFMIIGTNKYGQELYDSIEKDIDYDSNNSYNIIFPETVKMIAISGILGFFKKPILDGRLNFFVTNIQFSGDSSVVEEIQTFLRDNNG